MKSKINKELLILVLLFGATVLTIFLLFYDYFPSDDYDIKSTEYKEDEKVRATIEEIQKNGAMVSNGENKLLKTYTVDKSDLTVNSGEELETGKQNPFAETSNPIEK